jgi:hypothetical protein
MRSVAGNKGARDLTTSLVALLETASPPATFGGGALVYAL